ncbi:MULTISPECIES: efflux RND transporter periplasmic adaptor subunit [Rhodanobacter]|uniref:efflux RND transporter periplasmic adaptor subunit n=1 Tax=Rhodanobacter TaxID=75309 RepID=UPI0003F60C69|nr:MULTISPECIES: efflux RND transporter periplasmic adaptor subunit [Rhodanobacter]TAN14834.1 MAG: efflux RND transporter periplasmic adaptor subunit [Rhodanobacter sp.]UJJ56289.1 efflux RND transporter periplasmic adaptor subunit [Rhodanobacter thiooxydans]
MKSSSLSTPLLCLSLLALAACGKGKEQGPPQKMPPPEVGVIQVQPQNSPLTRNLVGRLSAYRSADVRARVAGVLLKRAYSEGTNVKQGQLLFQIDPAPLKATLNAAQASLAQAQATWTNNKITAARVHELAPKGYVSRSDLDNALAAERTAAAAVQAAQANVQTARINLGYASVSAPIAGRAGQQQVTEGALVGNGEATLLTTVDQVDPMYVNFTMSVDSMDQMRRAQSSGNVTLTEQDKASVQIALPDGSAYGEPGVLDFSDIAVNPATGAVNLRAVVPNPKHSLLPGMYVTLKANLGQQHNVFIVPQQAVQRDTGGTYVMTIGKDGNVKRKSVTTTDMRDGNWVVSDGLAAGDQIIVSGLQKVKDGAPAKSTPWKPATTNGSVTASAPGAAPNAK